MTETDLQVDGGTAILLTVTNLNVQGLAGGIPGELGIPSPPAIPGGIEITSAGTVVSPDGVAGFASMNGQYQTNTGGWGDRC